MSIVTNLAAFMNGRIVGHYVYLLVCGDGGRVFIKIGHSKDPFKRLNDMRVGCSVPPDTMGIVHVFSKDEAIKLEKALHAKMNNWHSHGEWIALTHEDRPEFRVKLQDVLKQFSRKSWPLKVKTIDANLIARRSQNLYTGRQGQKLSAQVAG